MGLVGGPGGRSGSLLPIFKSLTRPKMASVDARMKRGNEEENAELNWMVVVILVAPR